MHSDHERETAAPSGLSTADLARPRDTGTPDGPSNTPPEGVPMYPGESTPTPGQNAGDDTAADPGAGDEMVKAEHDPPSQDPDRDQEAEDQAPQLLTSEDAESFRTRWTQAQNKFIDDPRDAVQAADALVADVMQTLAATFADHKQALEGQWNRGEQANTEDLRQALRHYRSFFNRLLTT
ncbi:hypothetical protein [Streptomyces sp. NPDC005017]|uniref:hypothetical protein n=1 Tax=Streptomyces sp. NPDC005017 TaxID=3364706 RepID=UPI0036C729BB